MNLHMLQTSFNILPILFPVALKKKKLPYFKSKAQISNYFTCINLSMHL